MVAVVTHHLIGAAEVARMLGVSRQRVNDIVRTHADFPDPEAELTAGRIWSTHAVERWMRDHGYGRDGSKVTEVADVGVFQPDAFGDLNDATKMFLGSKAVLIDVREVDAPLARRVVDYASGLAVGQGGTIEPVLDRVLLLSPAGVRVDARRRRQLSMFLTGDTEGDVPEGVVGAIVRYFAEVHDLVLGSATAADVAASVAPHHGVEFEVVGSDVLTGTPKQVRASADELNAFIKKQGSRPRG